MAVPVRSIDPIPALRGFVELPLRISVTAPIAERLGRIEACFAEEQAAWPTIYQDALTVAEQLSAHWESRLEELQRQRLTMGDPSSLRQRQQSELRKEIERARSNARQAIGVVSSDWQPRLRRQVDYVMEEVGKRLEELELSDKLEEGELVIALDPGWKSRFETFLKEAAERWVASACSNFTEALSRELQPVVGGLAAVAPPPETLLTKAQPKAESMSLTLEAKRTEVAGFGAALMQSVRGNIMMVSMFGGVAAAVASLKGIGGGGSAGASLVRQYLLVVAIPLSLVAGYFMIKSDRARHRRKLLEQRRQEFRTLVKADCQRMAERQRDGLERTLLKQIPDAVVRNLESWISSQGEPAIQRAEERGAQAASDLALKLDKLAEEMNMLRSIRGQLVQQIAVDLRRRLRELSGAGPTPPR